MAKFNYTKWVTDYKNGKPLFEQGGMCEACGMQHEGACGMNEQYSNPFDGSGTGPNWDAARSAWVNWNSTNQGGAPTPDSTFLSNMQGKGCGFYEKRLKSQMNSFVNKFGGSFGGSGSSNPAWQSQKYARIMWLADEVRGCSGTGGGVVTCINDWIDDSSNDSILTSAQCANGNPAINAQNLANTKFRHKSIADCGQLSNKISEFAGLIQTSTGCSVVRKQAKHDYLVNLKNHCC